ncbi:hypothetical protein ACIQUQ_19820 [Streptomyces sp. NPDC101118]|uniref:effector-associated constant component EACC1 n=1 Tax=Streptomyces sp. NPDC101118 TaxID=3366109 RepID=UPI0038284979
MAHVVHVTLPGGGQAPDALRQFLGRDPGFRAAGRAGWVPAEAAAEGQLGTGLDVLTLAVTGVLALPSAIETVRRWCASPGQGDDTAVELRAGETVVRVTGATSPGQVAALAAALAQGLEPEATPSTNLSASIVDQASAQPEPEENR